MVDKQNLPKVSKVKTFKPWFGKVNFGQTTNKFDVITPNFNYN